jgi:hypothetical protein
MTLMPALTLQKKEPYRCVHTGTAGGSLLSGRASFDSTLRVPCMHDVQRCRVQAGSGSGSF